MRFVSLAVLLLSLMGCSDSSTKLLLMDGDYHEMSGPSEQFTVLNYWAIWCAPCRREIPELNEFDRQHDDIAVIGVNWDRDDIATTASYMEQMKIEFAVTQTDPIQLLQLARPDILPTTFVFNPQGELVTTLVGEQDAASIRAAISEYQALYD